MKIAALPLNEKERVLALKKYDILDTAEEVEFDDLVKLASYICNTPISLISLVDDTRQWFKAKVGVEPRETPRDIAFCPHVIYQNSLMVVNDATKDDRFSDNPLTINDPHVIFYAGAPLITSTGYTLGTLCVIDNKPNDLTDKQKESLVTIANQVINQLELRIKNKQLENLNKLKSKFFSIISHDLKKPIISFKNFMYLFDDDLSPEELLKIKVELNESIDSTYELLNNLFEWSSRQFNEDNPNLEYFNLKNMIENIFHLINHNANLKNIKLINHVDSTFNLKSDYNSIQFVLRNLTSNAIKFTKDGFIKCEASEDERNYYIYLEDSGIGMTDDVINNMFDWKNRISKDGTNGEKGTGLGLVLCFEFIQKLNGTILVKSTLGKGTTFTIVLPK